MEYAASSVSLLVAVFLAVLLSFLKWRPHMPAGSPYLLAAITSAGLWMLGGIFISSTPAGAPAQFYWYYLEATGSHLMPPLWLAFILSITNRTIWRTGRRKIFFFLPAALAISLAWSSPLHQLYWSAGFGSAGVFFWFGLMINQFYLLMSLVATLNGLRPSNPAGRSYLVILLLATLISGIANLFFLTRSFSTQFLTPSPYFLTFSLILFVYALFHLRMINLMPLATTAALEAMPSGVMVLDRKNQVQYINPAAEKFLGQPARAITGRPAAQALAPFPYLLDALQNPHSDQDNPRQVQVGGELAYVTVCANRLVDRWSKDIGIMFIIEDVTNRVTAEMATRESIAKQRQSEETYRQLVENLSEIIYIIDLNGQFTFISQGAERTLGLRAPDLLGRHVQQVISMDDSAALDAIIRRTLDGKKEIFEFRIPGSSGRTRILQARQQRLLLNGQVIGIQGLISDITDQLQVSQAMERRASQLAILNNIGEEIAALMDLDSVLDSATRLIQMSFGYYHVALFLPDPGHKELILRSSSGAFSSIFPENHRLKFG